MDGLLAFVYRFDTVEVNQCKAVAAERDGSARRQGLRDRHGASPEPTKGYQLHLLGVAGEVAFARFQGLDDFVPTVDTFRSMPDVEDFEVRCRSRHSYDLLVRSDDEVSKKYVLATCEGISEVYVWGWAEGEHAKQERFLQTYGGREPAYFVPKRELQPLDLLPWKGVT